MVAAADLESSQPARQSTEKQAQPRSDDEIKIALVEAILRADQAGVIDALGKGADPDTTIFINYNGEKLTLSVLMMAALLNDEATIDQLLQAGVRVGDACTMAAMIPLVEPLNSILPEGRAGGAVINNILQSQGVMRCDLHAPYRLDPNDPDHRLIAAIDDGDMERMKMLIASGASINARESRLPGEIVWPGRTALMAAVIGHRRDMAEFLIAAGADVSAKASYGNYWGGQDGVTTLMLAVQLRQNKLVQMLLAAGADPLASDEKKRGAIHDAAQIGDVAALTILIGGIPDMARQKLISMRTESGDTALTIAARSRKPEMVSYLIGVGRNILGDDYLRYWGNAAVIEAVTERDYGARPTEERLSSRKAGLAILTALLTNGANANAKDGKGTPILVRAVKDGADLYIIQVLIAHKADPHAPDTAGRDALSYARERADAEAVLRVLATPGQ